MKKKIINGIQQVGIGTPDADATFAWYNKYLGFDIRVFADEAQAGLMTHYTEGEVRSRYAILAMNLNGGGGLEIWQYTSRTPEAAPFEIQWGDLGIHGMKIRSRHIDQAHTTLKKANAKGLSDVLYSPDGNRHFFFTDPWGNLVEVVQDEYVFSPQRSPFGGVLGASIGVSDMEASIPFYRDLLGYHEVIYDVSGQFDDLRSLPGGNGEFRRVLLNHPPRQGGGFHKLLGPTEIELFQALDRTGQMIFAGRSWGDRGYIHLCFDIAGMDLLRKECAESGHPFTVDSANSFDMGDAAGHFTYIEDPDGTLIEFVETHKVPILKKFGLFINLKKRNPLKPLPDWLVKSMRIHRVKG